GRALNYERNPPTSADFYNHPVTALGWQTERWFQICSEAVGGYFKEVHGKDPVRINEIYSGTPGSVWSSNQNTNMVVDYFGPAGQGYIPLTPSELGGWAGGSSSDIVNAVNSGAFILQHRDHGLETGWGEPYFRNNNIDAITSTEPVFVFSINCLTGKYNWSSECFAEKWHRYEYGCLGMVTPSEVSYSFVNDAYVWGMYDNMWPDFMPDIQTDPEPRGLYPAFGNAGGKYFLQQSNWPYNTGNKEVTYFLFHHHGDAFTELYSEVPQNLTVSHDAVLLAGIDFFTVTADDGSRIALSVNGELIGVGEGTGGPVDISITPQYPPAMVDVVITKTNYYRYHAQVQVIPPSGPYVIKDSYTINDQAGNNNGQADYGETIKLSVDMKNVGSADALGVQVNIMSTDPFVTISDAQEDYGDVLAGETVSKADGFELTIAGDVPDNHQIIIDIEASDGNDGSWNSSLSLIAYAPKIEMLTYTVNDAVSGNGNGKFDAGETVDIVIDVTNTGSADAYNVIGELVCNDAYVTINSGPMTYGDLNSGNAENQAFSATSSAGTPPGYNATFDIDLTGDLGLTASDQFEISIGQIPILIVDFDGNTNSGPKMKQSIDNIGVTNEYSTSMPADPNLYSTIFVCLGIYSDNHQLTEAEGDALKTFLDAGNNLYMEGGDTWYYDPQRAVHPYFNITGLEDGSGDLGTLAGQAGSFTENMTYSYLGENNWIDHIAPSGNAFVIFKNQSPSYNAAIAYDDGSYKTIGSSFEFGGLGDGAYTRDELMEEYLNFFGFHGVPEAPPCPVGPTDMCQDAIDTEFTCLRIPDATSYFWSVDPTNAGVFSGSDTIGTIAWDPTFSGTALIQVCAINGSGQGPMSVALQVNVNPNPTVFMTGTTDICLGDSTQLTFDLTGGSPWTVIMNGGTTYTFSSSPSYEWVKPATSTDYTITSISDALGCVNTGVGNASITVIDIPEAAGIPNGLSTINTATTPTSNYTIASIPTADTYIWGISPSNAGQITPNGTNCDVVWETSFIGTATLTVKGNNSCGDGTEGVLQIGVNSQGVSDMVKGLGVNLYPNPSNGYCSIEMVSNTISEVTLKVLNTIGNQVYTSENISFSGNYSGIIDLSEQAEGMYFVVIESKAGNHIQKVIIQK
ncbi:C25 family cysteine peptidase, partial [Bacteroidota bacterium]